jgi:hypothetical protein
MSALCKIWIPAFAGMTGEKVFSNNDEFVDHVTAKSIIP